MSDSARTEAPTPRKLRRARAAGDVAKSLDLTRASVWLAGVAALAACGGWLVTRMLACVRLALDGVARGVDPITVLVGSLGLVAGPLLTVISCVFLAALAAGIAQVGPLWTLTPLVSHAPRSRAAGAWGVLQWLVMGLIVVGVGSAAVVEMAGSLPRWPSQPPIRVWTAGFDLLQRVAWWLGALALVWGGFDLWYQRHRHGMAQRMTRSELAREQRETEVDPRHRQARARLQAEARRAGTRSR